MKFSTREDVNAPIAEVFTRISNFQSLMHMIQGKGATVTRLDVLSMPSVGNSWNIKFQYRGKERELTATVDEIIPNEDIRIKMASEGLDGFWDIHLIELARGRTRMVVGVDLRPKNLPTRLFIQSMKLTKTSLTKKYRARIAGYARTLERAAA